MNRTKRAYWVLGMGLLALVAVVIYVSVVSNGGDTDTDDGRSTALLDEAGQSSRIETAETSEPKNDQNRQHEAETQQNVDADESLSEIPPAILYDVAGGVGEPPEDWKEDYSHWDSNFGDELVKVGMIEREEGIDIIYRPTEAARRRESELEEEMLKAAEDGLLSREPKGDYIRQEIEAGKVVYVAPNFVDQYNALLEEYVAINEQHMHTVPKAGYSSTPSLGTIKFDSGLQIDYYRRKGDGSLVRSVDLPSGGTKEYVLADSEPDLSGFSDEEIEMIKKSWR
ncbi:MAG: hypothetical protein OXT69_13960 [Candidatus Poribacteria bacterium]|nr:hypothetical protein [Candidatus Poribacteria bacterium]